MKNGYATNLYRLEGYKDRLAHRPGRPKFMSGTEQVAYEEGVAQAEREMGFSPGVGSVTKTGERKCGLTTQLPRARSD